MTGAEMLYFLVGLLVIGGFYEMIFREDEA